MTEPTSGDPNAPPGDLREKVQRALPYSLGIAVLQIGLSLVSILLLVRYLDPREYGVWALLLAAPGIVQLWISFGNHYYISRFIPGRPDLPGVAAEVWSIVIRRLLLAGAVSLALVLSFPLYSARFDLIGYFDHLVVYQAALILNIGNIYLDLALRARFLQKHILAISLAVQCLIVTATVVGIERGEDLLYFVQVVSAAAVVNFASFATAFGATHGPPRIATLLRPPARTAEARSYTRATYLADFGVAFLHTDIDRYLIGFFSSNVHVALYAVAATIYTRLQQLLPRALFRSLLDATFFSRFEQTRDPRELNRMFRFIFKTSALPTFYFLSIFVPLGHEILGFLFRDAYAAAYGAVVIFLACMTFTAMPVDMTLMALKESKILVYAQAPLVLNFALGIPLVIYFGATGMAFATATSVVLKNTIMYIYARRRFTLQIPWGACFRCAAAATVAGLAALSSARMAGLLPAIAAGTVVYALFVRMLKPLDEEERGLLSKMIPDRLGFAIPLLLGRAS
jgi:O-antigen/teichoic acid export membrane protein